MRKNNPKILIIGTGDLRNYGCEAIVQGTYAILKKTFPGCSIYLASDNKDYDRGILPDDIQLVSYKNRFTPYRIIKGLLRRFLKIGQGSEVRMKTSIGRKFDIVLSAGGDNYCERPDHGIYNLLVDLMKIGLNAVNHGRMYNVWGGSIGPFSDPEIEKTVVKNLSLTSAIFVREEKTRDYISRFSELKDKCVLVADPAFQMTRADYPVVKKENVLYVGINMSELAVGHSLNSDRISMSESKVRFSKFLDSFLDRNNNVEFILIPHVNMTGPQDDMNFLNPVFEKCTHKDRIHIFPAGLGARKTKAMIGQLDLLVAARMHCCVAGISTSTPTLFITYSNKGKGMSHYAYAHDRYDISVVDMYKNPDSFIEKMEHMLANSADIRKYLAEQSERFNADSIRSGQILYRLYSDIK